MTVESVIDMSDEAERIRFIDTALVEGAVASAVRAQLGDDLDQVAAVAASLAPRMEDIDAPGAPEAAGAPRAGEGTPAASVLSEPRARGEAVVADPVGLHARPAAAFVRLAASFDADVTVNGADGGSVLELMALGVTQGQRVLIEATGADATRAVAALTDMLERTDNHTCELKETT